MEGRLTQARRQILDRATATEDRDSRKGAHDEGAENPAAGGSPASDGTASEMQAVDLARRCAEILDSKRLSDVSIFDVSRTLQISDFFVIASGTSTRQIQSACDAIEQELKKRGVTRFGIEGYSEGKWVLLDYDIVVIHLFLEEQRRYYDLELLWGDSPRVSWSSETVASGDESRDASQ